jgi:quinol monooxygenase YgiN
MVILAGHVTVDPEQREPYLAGSMSVVKKARQADACLDSAITADLLDPGRVNLFERWESQEAVKTFRRRGPSTKQRAAMLSVSLAEYDIADVRPPAARRRRRHDHRPLLRCDDLKPC